MLLVRYDQPKAYLTLSKFESKLRRTIGYMDIDANGCSSEEGWFTIPLVHGAQSYGAQSLFSSHPLVTPQNRMVRQALLCMSHVIAGSDLVVYRYAGFQPVDRSESTSTPAGTYIRHDGEISFLHPSQKKRTCRTGKTHPPSITGCL